MWGAVSYFKQALAEGEPSFAQFELQHSDCKDEGSYCMPIDGKLHVITKLGKYFKVEIQNETLIKD